MAAVADPDKTQFSGAPGVELCVFCNGLIEATRKPVSQHWLGRMVREIPKELSVDVLTLSDEEKYAYKTMSLALPFFEKAKNALESTLNSTTITFEPETTEILVHTSKGESFKVHETIGKGTYALVDKVSLGSLQFAAKYIRRENSRVGKFGPGRLSKAESTLEKELKVGLLAHHSDHVTRPLLLLKDPRGSPVLIFPLATETVDSLIPKLIKETVHTICFSFLQGLKALEKHPFGPIVHNDLSCSNILGWNRKKFTINDFGLSERKGAIISPLFAFHQSPEHHKDTLKVDASIDIWSFGAILLQLFTGESFKHNIKIEEFCTDGGILRVSQSLIDKHSKRVDELDPTGELRNIMYKCLEFDPKKRPSLDEVIADFSAIDGVSTGGAAAGGGGSKKGDVERKSPEFSSEKKEEEAIKAATAAGDGK